MPPVTNELLVRLAPIAYWLLTAYSFLIIIRVLLSWINPNPYSPFMRFLISATEPAFRLSRRYFRLTLGGLDFSPIFLLIILQLLATVAGEGLKYLGHGFSFLVLVPIIVMSLLGLVHSLAWLLMLIMIVRLIMSLVNPAPYNPLVLIVYALTEPLLLPLRRFVNRGPYGLDLRALVFLAIVFLIDWVVVGQLGQVVGKWLISLSAV